MNPSLSDLLGVTVWTWYLLAAVAATVTTIKYLYLTVATPRFTPLLLCVMTVLILAYIVVYLLDIPSIVAVLNNTYTDIPPSSNWRTGIAAAMWTFVWWAVPVIAKGRIR